VNVLKKAVLILGFLFVLLAGLFVTLPAMADPTNGQKVEITLTWTPGSYTYSTHITGPIIHRHLEYNWKVTLTFVDDGTTYVGTAFTERDVTIIPDDTGTKRTYQDYYTIDFPDQEGGFEGNAVLIVQNYGTSSATQMIHGLFKGTGQLEGQTINAGVLPWGPLSSFVWEGYLLKP
jgi:ABC-type proline/glycine betaine transport system substrate-binding protein